MRYEPGAWVLVRDRRHDRKRREDGCLLAFVVGIDHRHDRLVVRRWRNGALAGRGFVWHSEVLSSAELDPRLGPAIAWLETERDRIAERA